MSLVTAYSYSLLPAQTLKVEPSKRLKMVSTRAIAFDPASPLAMHHGARKAVHIPRVLEHAISQAVPWHVAESMIIPIRRQTPKKVREIRREMAESGANVCYLNLPEQEDIETPLIAQSAD